MGAMSRTVAHRTATASVIPAVARVLLSRTADAFAMRSATGGIGRSTNAMIASRSVGAPVRG